MRSGGVPGEDFDMENSMLTVPGANCLVLEWKTQDFLNLYVFFPTVSVVVVRFSSDSFLLPSFLPSSSSSSSAPPPSPPSPPPPPPPLLLLLPNAVQLTVPIGDDGQRCPVAGPSYDIVQMQYS